MVADSHSKNVLVGLESVWSVHHMAFINGLCCNLLHRQIMSNNLPLMFFFQNDFHIGLRADGDIFGWYTLQQLEVRITHVAVLGQLFKVHWPHLHF